MALRNISNIHQNQNMHDLFFYNNTNHYQTVVATKPSFHSNYQQFIVKNNENKMKSLQQQQTIKPATSAISICSTTSSSASTKSSSSIKIRTSSPISSSESSSSSSSNEYAHVGPSNTTEISPSKFMKAVRNHKSRKSSQPMTSTQQQLPHFVSMKELAFEKLKKQQLIEHDLKHTFNLHNQLNARQLTQQVRLKSSGKLKCAIYNNLNHLTVHIIEARQLKSDPMSSSSHLNTIPFDTYVKITMLPDVEQRFNKYQTPLTKCLPPQHHNQQAAKMMFSNSTGGSSLSSLSNASSNASSTSNNTNPTTNAIDFTNNFYYDQKFSFEFDQMTDMNNRLIVSVWSHAHTLIGCFSFKIKHLLKSSRVANAKAAWYHLLPLKYGMSKHLVSKSEMNSRNSHIMNRHQQTKSQTDLVSNLNKDLQGMQRIGLSVVRAHEQESFGFTVTNSCPCAIGKVEMGKSGHRAGLRVGDFIACVNGQNVSRATCETVVKMIKSCKLRLDIEVYREQTIIDASLCQGVTGSNEIDFIATKLLNSHLEYQQKLACKNYENQQMFYKNDNEVSVVDYENGNNLNLESIEYRLSEQPKQSSHQNVNQFGLEVVLEEEEEEEEEDVNEISDVEVYDNDDEEGENDYHDLDMDVQEEKDTQYIGYIHAEQKLRHVDSSSNDEEAYNDDKYYAQKEADLLRKAAQQFYSHTNNCDGMKKANILSLRNLKLDEHGQQQSSQQAFNYF